MSSLQPTELGLLTGSQWDKTRLVQITVTGCAYSCCGKGWQRKDGYEQVYSGWVDNLKLPEGPYEGSFMLYSAGLGTLSYVVAVLFSEVESVDPLP
jgi:hypothetical protein